MHTLSIGLSHVAWDAPDLRRSQESGFIHLTGRIWTKTSSVIDEGRYGVGGSVDKLRGAAQTEKLLGIECDSDKFKTSLRVFKLNRE